MTMTTARDWLIAGAPGADTSPEVLAGTCERLIAEGVPISRAEAYVRTLHPLVAGRAFEWTPAHGCQAIEAVHDADLGATSGPIRNVFATAKPQRNRLVGTGARKTNPYLDEMVSMGMTDVIALPFVFTTGDVHAVAFATDHEAGFEARDIARIEEVVPPLTRMAEILALRRSAANVLTAYVGRDAGARVLAGKIRRGDIELIEAAIWFSDMRGFSAMSNHKEPREVIDVLNELFDCQVPAIEKYGGEVLKFIGDGLLAIFTPRDGGDMAECCRRALAASGEALLAIEDRNGDAIEPVKIGIALHVGQVAYGNIGGAARLDFTCIGRAVNLAARLESLTGKTGHDVLASAEFARVCGDMERVGAFEVKGFGKPIEAFVPGA
ncbi:MAG TPA: adenylate/guanylate cyclase domain-containing protein [Kofleriaceae bacterium]|nr:adenylate/guanylate cyclase domain-containing protein [Kofleriaceae bacterium]